ncbi:MULTISPECIES: pilus assembly protein PilM [unclassified Methylophaga]|jgi:type IV pilus assembly protein PilM|uniref:pilus assembly protein PilM n=1 Tax=unclassified Methylophaga TaxID=2629249 RepID=UPI000C92FD2B|nr:MULTISPECIES: pilus assembly protein PilM [unclassified Methylophaga]MAK66801.1 pilus assembly protein PilM [Methylophaga sp.]MAY17631.1 pilus assembly protein PilM [Methylophaga sp.]MBN47068.1 pilus assembly protein PilM [Methylophaga sp.]HAO25419.1 pilus assembly protein PilM [Methylophaga sp.]HCD06279.1 pilus assembly protein PilM [Methylophaga sp.]|tara:strand:- start:13438 stop:14496 length:1059 start_codon:yes stop_codon:yes gene_type:complete
MFGRKKSPLLGIDISSSVVKLLELNKRGDRYTVESYAVEPLPVNAVVEGRIENSDEVAGAIKRAVKRSGTKSKDAAVAVSANSAITKVVSFPASISERDMEENVMLEAENYIPYPLDEVRLDFEILGPSAADADAVDVLLAASRRENVDARTDVLEKAGLKPRLVDVEAYTVENAFSLIARQLPNQGNGLTVAVADVGANVTTLHVLVNGKIVFTREQTFGGRMLTEDIERYYGMSYQEAGRAKKDGSLPDDYQPKVLEPFKRSMAVTITRALQFFFSASSQYQSIDHIIIAGGCASIEGVDQIVEAETGTSTSVANPFTDMALGSRVKVQAISNDAPSMMIACGLAMRSFD